MIVVYRTKGKPGESNRQFPQKSRKSRSTCVNGPSNFIFIVDLFLLPVYFHCPFVSIAHLFLLSICFHCRLIVIVYRLVSSPSLGISLVKSSASMRSAASSPSMISPIISPPGKSCSQTGGRAAPLMFARMLVRKCHRRRSSETGLGLGARQAKPRVRPSTLKSSSWKQTTL